MPDHVLRPRGGGCDFVDVKGRGVAGQDRAGLGHLIDFGEYLLLQRHPFKHCFSDDVRVVEPVVGELRPDQGHALVHDLLREAPLLHRIGVILSDRRQPAIESFLCGLLEDHRNAGIDVIHRDAATHRSGADHCRFADLAHRRVFRQKRDLGDFAFPEEGVDHRLRLIRKQALEE